MNMIVTVLLIVLLGSALPTWPHSAGGDITRVAGWG